MSADGGPQPVVTADGIATSDTHQSPPPGQVPSNARPAVQQSTEENYTARSYEHYRRSRESNAYMDTVSAEMLTEIPRRRRNVRRGYVRVTASPSRSPPFFSPPSAGPVSSPDIPLSSRLSRRSSLLLALEHSSDQAVPHPLLFRNMVIQRQGTPTEGIARDVVAARPVTASGFGAPSLPMTVPAASSESFILPHESPGDPTSDLSQTTIGSGPPPGVVQASDHLIPPSSIAALSEQRITTDSARPITTNMIAAATADGHQWDGTTIANYAGPGSIGFGPDCVGDSALTEEARRFLVDYCFQHLHIPEQNSETHLEVHWGKTLRTHQAPEGGLVTKENVERILELLAQNASAGGRGVVEFHLDGDAKVEFVELLGPRGAARLFGSIGVAAANAWDGKITIKDMGIAGVTDATNGL